MKCPGIASMSVPERSEAGHYLVTSFCPGDKNKPAKVNLLRYPAMVPSDGPSYPSVCSKSLFQAEEATVHWSPKGDAALMALQTSIDTSGESYYGSTTLYLMSESSSDPVTVPLPSNSTGPVLDVSWMPNPSKPPCFVVISGRMPAMASLHNGSTGEAIFLFGNAHRNTICWADHGRFVCLAGFGNLAGGMTFWDHNKLKAMPQYDEATGSPIFPELKASCTVGYGWSPDSRLFGSSTTSPRMNVDNGARVYRYNGEEMTNVPWNNANYKPDRLLQASFVPALPNVYPDRGQSPAPKIIGDATAVAEAKKQASEAATKPAPPSVGRYVPPSARGRSSGTSLADRIRAEKEGKIVTATKVETKPIVPGASAVAKKSVPVGMAAALTDEKSKNAQRREKQKLAKAKKDEEESKLKADQEAAEQATREAAASDPAKIARKLKKNLKQIEELKAKDPTTLNDEQKKKVASEAALLTELAKLSV
jgi:translation initiation factor 2A